MTRIRQALAVALVATALCADRPATATPVERVQPESVATKLVEHLSVSFRRMAPAVRLDEVRRTEVPTANAPLAIASQSATAQHVHSPFQFRLPPPIL
ncbi:MAG TPA: hypothetical protein VL282_16580 [Tepidisphaeraceae bacterium]|jgi:hypothetical protein|nr:hypothetical protein [Tepidisphaeraceae bacterium]